MVSTLKGKERKLSEQMRGCLCAMQTAVMNMYGVVCFHRFNFLVCVLASHSLPCRAKSNRKEYHVGGLHYRNLLWTVPKKP